ncbi:hypothetical protein V1291_004607 [Nitrobacteraceae bacterium AZCC 1564]
MSKRATKPRSAVETRAVVAKRTSTKRTSKISVKAAKKVSATRTVAKAGKKASKTEAKKTAARKSASKKTAMKKTSRKSAVKSSSPNSTQPVLLSGGNPQIAKGYGDAPVQAYIAAMPGWKRNIGRALDELVVRTVPGVHKAVKWNSPLYGIEGQGWFLSLHCFTHYVKVAFFRGASLRPVPPGASKHKDVRYLDIREDDEIDEAQLRSWVKQASELPGEKM